MIATLCDAYVMHGDPAEAIAPKIADMKARRAGGGRRADAFGMAAYAIVRDSEAEAKARARADHRAAAQAARRASTISSNGSRAPSSSAS